MISRRWTAATFTLRPASNSPTTRRTRSTSHCKFESTAWSKYRVQFIGRAGRVLSEVGENTASYTFKGDEGYVRVKVLESNGLTA